MIQGDTKRYVAKIADASGDNLGVVAKLSVYVQLRPRSVEVYRDPDNNLADIIQNGSLLRVHKIIREA